MVICLGWPSPATSSSLPAASLSLAMLGVGMVGVGHTSPPIWPCSDWGLPCHRCCQRRGGLLPHRFTLTLVPAFRPRLWAVCSLWPYPSPYGAQELPGSLPDGARTFLGRLAAPATTVLDQWLEDNKAPSWVLGALTAGNCNSYRALQLPAPRYPATPTLASPRWAC
jgi:hypothetical protein